MRGPFWRVLRRAQRRISVRSQHLAGFKEVGRLKAQARPGTLAFTTAVEARGGSGEGEFGQDLGLAHGFRVEHRLVEADRPRDVLCPEEALELFDVHRRTVSGNRILANQMKVVCSWAVELLWARRAEPVAGPAFASPPPVRGIQTATKLLARTLDPGIVRSGWRVAVEALAHFLKDTRLGLRCSHGNLNVKWIRTVERSKAGGQKTATSLCVAGLQGG